MKLTPLKATKNGQDGFTLMEIIVATTIFATVSAAMLALFNYTLVINRRSEALRQATQGMRNMMELIVKEIRNGQINYLVQPGGSLPAAAIGPCTPPVFSGGPPYTSVGPTYDFEDNRLGLISLEGDEECLYLGYGKEIAGQYKNYVGSGIFKSNTTVGSPNYNPNPVLVLQKKNMTTETLNPPNFSVESLKFYIRPTKDPYSPLGGYSKTQPYVTISARFSLKLPTGESVKINYQTSVSTNKYDVPNQ